MTRIEDYGTRNSDVAQKTAKIVTEEATRTVTDITAYKDRTGRSWLSFEFDGDAGRLVSLPFEPMIGLRHFTVSTDENGMKHFEEHKENTAHVWSIEFEGKVIPKEDLFGFLERTGPDVKGLRVNMDNAFVRYMSTYDCHESGRAKLRALIWAIPSLGLIGRDTVAGKRLEKRIVNKDGVPMSAEDIVNIYRSLAERPKIRCSLTMESRMTSTGMRDFYSIQGIKRA